MSATDRVITLAYFLKFEAPGGDVRISDGGQLEYDGEVYTSEDARFGSLYQGGAIEASFGDMAETGEIVFSPSPSAALSDWWRDDLYDSRVRIFMGEVDSDGYTVSTARLLSDMLVDTVQRSQGPSGQNLLTLTLIGRAEKLFLINEGNVCSERFHESVWTGEDGFDNCTNLVGFVAWGTASPRATSTSGSGSGGFLVSVDRS